MNGMWIKFKFVFFLGDLKYLIKEQPISYETSKYWLLDIKQDT